jgi:hypothetical protein
MAYSKAKLKSSGYFNYNFHGHTLNARAVQRITCDELLRKHATIKKYYIQKISTYMSYFSM